MARRTNMATRTNMTKEEKAAIKVASNAAVKAAIADEAAAKAAAKAEDEAAAKAAANEELRAAIAAGDAVRAAAKAAADKLDAEPLYKLFASIGDDKDALKAARASLLRRITIDEAAVIEQLASVPAGYRKDVVDAINNGRKQDWIDKQVDLWGALGSSLPTFVALKGDAVAESLAQNGKAAALYMAVLRRDNPGAAKKLAAVSFDETKGRSVNAVLDVLKAAANAVDLSVDNAALVRGVKALAAQGKYIYAGVIMTTVNQLGIFAALRVMHDSQSSITQCIKHRNKIVAAMKLDF